MTALDPVALNCETVAAVDTYYEESLSHVNSWRAGEQLTFPPAVLRFIYLPVVRGREGGGLTRHYIKSFEGHGPHDQPKQPPQGKKPCY